MAAELKIVFTGPPGAGKTTAIEVLSDSMPLQTEAVNTDGTLGKQLTTVAFDFGQIRLDDRLSLRLFGTPGQQRYDFMWRILARDALGLILLIDNSRADPLDDLVQFLDAYGEILPSANCVVGLGRTQWCPYPTIEQFNDVISARGMVLPVLAVDVRQRGDVLMLVDAVLSQAEAREGDAS